VTRQRCQLLLSAAGLSVVAAVTSLAAAFSPEPATVITVWVVGSPYTENAPQTPAARSLRDAARRSDYGMSIVTFPAQKFAEVFADAITRNAVPDVLVFDNFGVMDGTTTPLGRFEGIGRDPTVRAQFINVTGAFDELLGPARGWTYLFASSSHHTAARNLALRGPGCSGDSAAARVDRDLAHVIPDVVTAYLKGDEIGVQAYADPDRLPGVRLAGTATQVGGLQTCDVWGNGKLAIASVKAAYESQTMLGEVRVLLVFRRPAAHWQLLVATRDPIATSEFVRNVGGVMVLSSSDGHSGAPLIPATLISPISGQFPHRPNGERFGSFTWASSPSEDVIAEIAEFAYATDERLFVTSPATPAAHRAVSGGQLWTTRGEWSWRIWSVSRNGELVFSESRAFVH
jgi:hypothetical protein